MVDIIMARKGIIDKFIGNSILAYFGAPIKHKDDTLQSVLSGLDMVDALTEFNKQQAEKNIPPLDIGIGISYGPVVVGFIGCEKKTDYSLIGNIVNIAEQLQKLTKFYKQKIIISEDLRNCVVDDIQCRMIDKININIKGKTKALNIYSVFKELSESEKKGWKLHGDAMKLYFNCDFKRAKNTFIEVIKYLPDDFIADIYIQRCNNYIKNPPPDTWDGSIDIDR